MSADASAMVFKYLTNIAPGVSLRIFAASANFCDACNSPSACRMRALRLRSASAWAAIALWRFSERVTSLISTEETFTPHGSVARSTMP